MSEYSSFGEDALEEMREVLKFKRGRYAGDRGEFWNFEFAAGVASLDPLDVIVAQLAIKIGRLKTQRDLKGGREEMEDTSLDILGYAAILRGYIKSMEEDEGS